MQLCGLTLRFWLVRPRWYAWYVFVHRLQHLQTCQRLTNRHRGSNLFQTKYMSFIIPERNWHPWPVWDRNCLSSRFSFTSHKHVVPSKLAVSSHFPDFEKRTANMGPFSRMPLTCRINIGLRSRSFLPDVVDVRNRVLLSQCIFEVQSRTSQLQVEIHPDSNVMTSSHLVQIWRNFRASEAVVESVQTH